MKALRTSCLLLPILAIAACGGESVPLEPHEIDSVSEAVLSGALPYRGVNLAGAEFGVDGNGNGHVPGTYGTDYIYPDPNYASGYNSASYYVSKGMTTFRLPFRWERLQPTRNQAFNAAELTRLTTTVNDLLAKGAAVVIDPHNYARYGTSVIGSSAVPNSHFADFWSRLATQFKGNSRVIFGLMNEPHDMSTEQWASAAQAAITAIRATGATNLILVPGNGWTSAVGWNQNWYGTADGTALLSINDPGNNYAYEVHQYLDDNSSGTGSSCPSATVGSQRLADFTSWLKAHNKRAFLGEFDAPSNQTCYSAMDDMLKYIESNQSVWLGWTYWAGGPWWGDDSLEPKNGADKAQMTVLLPHLSWGGGSSGGSSSSSSSSSSTGSSSGSTGGSSSSSSSSSSGSASSSSGGGSGTCTTTKYAATSMYHSVGGTTTGGWMLWGNGYASTNHPFVGGTTKITVYASGQQALNVWPHMVVSVGGVKIGEATVNSSTWKAYTFTYAATAGTKEIRVTYDNDYWDSAHNQDRNLSLQQVVVSCN